MCLNHALAQLNNYYLPASSNDYAPRPPPLVTEYFSYSAPPEEDLSSQLQAARQLAKAITPPQQVVFIRTPETNLFTLTAKQLAAHNALDIYVLQRQMDAAALEQQRVAIEQQLGHKPSVHFVKYRTPTDVSRALNSLRSSYDRLPGRTSSHAVETAKVIELNPLQQQQQLRLQPQPLPQQAPSQPLLQQARSQPLPLPQQLPQQLPQTEPVVFQILPKNGADYETHEQVNELEAAKLQALFRQYLPPAKRR